MGRDLAGRSWLHKNQSTAALTLIRVGTPNPASLMLSSESIKMFAPGGEEEPHTYMLLLSLNIFTTDTHTPLISLCMILQLWR